MKFIKANLVLVICGAVVLLALVSIWYPTLSWEADKATTWGQDYKDRISSIDNKTHTQLVLPGVPAPTPTTGPATAPGNYVAQGIPTDNLREAKKKANDDMKREADKVIRIGADANRRNRINNQGVPLLDGKAQNGYLPKITGVDPEQFKNDYNAQFDKWLATLVGPKHGTSYPPSIEELNAAFTQKYNASVAGVPAGLQSPVANQPGSKEMNDYIRKGVMTRATLINMYVDQGPPVEGIPAGMLNAFQRRAWASEAAPPNEVDIFEALVDSWFQSDVVRAIAAVNDEALKTVEPAKKNVGAAPIKRLMKISVGNPDANTPRLGTNTAGGGGGLGGGGLGAPAGGGAPTSTGLWFLPNASAAQPTGDAAVTPVGPGSPNNIDFTRTLTGRASGSDYDVVQMQIWMDIDPAALNKFVESLYKQNMGYTVLSIKFKTVDPLDRASNGFIYGDSQVIECEILVEGLLFRDWTQKLMPKDTAAYLGVVPPAPPAAN